MSVKHLEYLKISNSKVLVVEVRPVKCLLDTPSGPVHTDKWMDHSHWKELKHLMLEVVKEYEEQKITQGVKYNQPKCKTGGTIQIGYMFCNLPSCWCSLYFLTPRGTWSSTDNDFSGKLQDKGGRFEGLSQCGEMLVLSVILQDSSPLNTIEASPSSSSCGTFQQARLKHKLMKALDIQTTHSTSISDYFKSTTGSSSARCVPSSSGWRQKSSPLRVKNLTSKRCNQHESYENKGEAENMRDCSDYDSSLSPSTRFYEREVNSETLGGIALPNFFDSEVNIFSKAKSPPNSVECAKVNNTVNSHEKNLENDNKRPMESASEDGDINLDAIYSNYNSLTSEREKSLSFKKLEHQYGTSNDGIDIFDMNTSPCSPLRSDSQLENYNVQHQTYPCLFTRSTLEADENRKLASLVYNPTMFGQAKDVITGNEDYFASCKIGNPQKTLVSDLAETGEKVRTQEVCKSDECILNANGNEIQMENIENTLPYKVCNDSLPETNTCIRENSPRPEAERTSLSCVLGPENLFDCEQMSQYVKSLDYGHEVVKEEEYIESDSYQSNSELLHDISAVNSSGQNFPSATADSASEVNEKNCAPSCLEYYGTRCLGNEETGYVYPEIKFEDNGPCSAEEEYIPSKVSCKWKKNNKLTVPVVKPEKKHLRNFAVENHGSYYTVNNSVMQEGDFADKTGVLYSDSDEDTDRYGIEFENNATCRAEEEYVPEKITCNWKKRKSKMNTSYLEIENVPTNERGTANYGSSLDDDPEVQESDLTQVSGSLPLCVNNEVGVNKGKQQLIQETEVIAPFAICKQESDMEIACDENDSFFVEKFGSWNILSSVDIQQKCVPPQRLTSDANEKNSNMSSHPQSLQNCVQSSKLNREPLKKSTVINDQEGDNGVKKNNLIKQLQAFRVNRHCRSEGETCLKRVSSMSQKVNNQIGIRRKRQKELKPKKNQTHTSSSDADTDNENVLERSVMEDTIPSQNSRIVSTSCLEKAKSFVHELNTNSHESSTYILGKQSAEVKGGDPGCKCVSKSGKSKKLSSNCKGCSQRTTALKKNREGQLSISSTSHKMKVAKTDATTQVCMSTRLMIQKTKRKCVPVNGEKKTAKTSKSAEECVTQTEGSDQSQQDAWMVHECCESSQNCTALKTCNSIRLSENDASDILQSQEHQTETGLRRSNRVKERPACCCNVLQNDSSFAAETEKSIQFFEKYVKERNTSKSDLKQKKISDYVKPYKTLEQENYNGEFMVPHKKKNPIIVNRNISKPDTSTKENDDGDFMVTHMENNYINVKRKISGPGKSAKIKNVTSQKLHRKDNSKSKLSELTANQSSSDTSESLEQLALKNPPKACALTSHDGQKREKAKNNNTYMKTKRKKSPSQEREVSPTISIKKRVRKKKTVKNNTSAESDLSENLESHASTSEVDPLLWIIQAEMEELDPVVSDVDSLPERTTESNSSPRTEESEESVKEKLQPSEGEDDVDIVYFESLTSLRESYRRLHDMTNVELEQRMDEYLPYLEHVIQGLVPNVRHEMFVSSIEELKRQPDYLICGPFTADQTEYVLDLLKKKLSHMDKLFGNMCDVLTYRCRVLMPTFFTKLVMENENVSLLKAEQLLLKFSVDRNIIGTSDTRD